jgi:hypothetical protein
MRLIKLTYEVVIWLSVLALHNMGYNYHLKGQLRESIEAFEQSLALRSSLHASGDLNVAQSMIED